MRNIACVILAAGRGTRMKSSIPKPLHEIHGRPILEYLTETVKEAGIRDLVLVLGHGAESVKKKFRGFDTVIQSKQLGSGDAVARTRKCFKKYRGDIMVLYSDTPLLKKDTLKDLIRKHRVESHGCTLLTTRVPDPRGYGRIVRDKRDGIIKIVEDNEATPAEKVIQEINIGAYVFKKEVLYDYLAKIRLNGKKKEYYLTDIIKIMHEDGVTIESVSTEDISESLGINSRRELAKANGIVRERVLGEFMASGVTIVDPSSTHIDSEAEISPDTVIYPNTIIEKDVVIGPYCSIGPFAHLRPGTELASNVEIGNFVELVRTKVGEKCRIKHKTYLGDTVLGKNINVGAGTITANYDGKNKNKTYIGDNAFLGVGCILIAPVKVGRNAVVGAGSVVTKGHNVPDGTTVAGIPARMFEKK